KIAGGNPLGGDDSMRAQQPADDGPRLVGRSGKLLERIGGRMAGSTGKLEQLRSAGDAPGADATGRTLERVGQRRNAGRRSGAHAGDEHIGLAVEELQYLPLQR